MIYRMIFSIKFFAYLQIMALDGFFQETLVQI